MSDCDKEYNVYGGESTGEAIASGITQGVFGLSGLSGFFGKPYDESALNSLKNDFSNLQDNWQNIISNQKAIYTNDQKTFATQQKSFLQATEEFNNEILNEKIGDLGLGVAFLIAFLVVIIIYLVIS